MINNKRILIVGLILIVTLLAFFFRRNEPAKPLRTIPSFDKGGTEQQVADKLKRLRDELERNSDSAGLWGKFAMNLHIHGFKEQALHSYRQASDLDNAEFRWPYFCGILLDEAGSDEADLWFERARKIRSDYLPLLIRTGQRLLRAGNTAAAASEFRKAIELDPHCSHAYLGLAEVSLLDKKIEESLNYLKKAKEENPKHREVLNLLSTLYRRISDVQKSEQERIAASPLPDRTPLIDPVYASLVEEGVSSYWHRVRGRTYLENGRYAEAAREFEAAVRWKEDEETYNNLGAVRERQGKFNEAIRLYQKSIAIHPTALAYSNLGSVYGKASRLQDAIEASQESIRLKPNADAYFNIGVAYFKFERWHNAIEALQKTIHLDPARASALFALTQCHLAVGDRHSALQTWTALNRVNPALAEKLKYFSAQEK